MAATPSPAIGQVRLVREVHDLGDIDPRLQGILSPGYSDSEVRRHIHDLFLAKAEQFAAFCPIDRPLIEHWKDLIRAAIGPYLSKDLETVLDIGSGGGTSVFPMLELLPNARVFASDLSLPLLAQLRNYARREGCGERLTVMQMNAEEIVLADAQADVVMGANVLHHAVSLEATLREIRRVLKPGGVAVFWEPFEAGAQINAGIFEILLEGDKARREKLPAGMTEAMRSFIADVQRRRGRSKPKEVLLALDDKWYFSERWLRDLAGSAGFASCSIKSCYGTHNVVWLMLKHELARAGFDADQLPRWAREKVLEVQDRYSDDWLANNIYEAAIVLEPNRETPSLKPTAGVSERAETSPTTTAGLSGPARSLIAPRDSSLPAVVDEILKVAEGLHACGTFGRGALAALARHLGKREISHSVETGSGASTLLFSHLSREHTVFSIDSGGGSVVNVKGSPLFSAETVTWIEGPTQQTLPKYEFKHKLQAVLIDGPHAYPFPDLEYYFLYRHLEPGALLALDDIQIPTIHKLFDFLRQDVMFTLDEVVETTAFFTRTDAPTFFPFGDGWWEQKYNTDQKNEAQAILELQAALAAKDKELANLTADKARVQDELERMGGELNAIHGSRGWKALAVYYRLRHRLMGH